jgi:methyl-accepting chemotaxis protein
MRMKLMINIRTRVILSFLMVVFISIVTVTGISYIGYNLVVSGIISSTDNNNVRVNGIHEIKDLLYNEQQLISESIVNSDISRNEEFKKMNDLIKNSIDKLTKQLETKDANELKNLDALNKQYFESYNNVLSAMQQSDRKELSSLFAAFKANFDTLLQQEQKLKDLFNISADTRLKSVLSAADMVKNMAGEQSAELPDILADIQKVKDEINTIASLPVLDSQSTGNSEYQMLAEDIGNRLAVIEKAISAAVLTSDITGKVFDESGIDSITDEISALNNAGRLIYWSQVKFGAAAAAIVTEGGIPAEYSQAEEKLRGYLEALMVSIPTQSRELADSINQADTALDENFNKIWDSFKSIENAQLGQKYSDAGAVFDLQQASLNKLESSFKQYLAKDIADSNRLKSNLIKILAGMALLSLFIGMLTAMLLSSNILKPIKSLTSLLGKAENGDLTVRISNKRKDEIGRLGEKVNNVLDGHQRMVEQVKSTNSDIGVIKKKLSDLFLHSRDNAVKVSNGVKNVIDSIKTGVKHPGESLREINEITAGVEGLSDATDKVVRDGMKAVEMAVTGEKSVEEAETVIKNVTDTVRQIADSINQLDASSNKIGVITNTITEIATKTNLLALNAAIEAARAGQQGKGFTVLADEIRKLAEGSNKAAGEIKHLIAEIQNRIQFAVDKIGDGVSSVDMGVIKINTAKTNILDITEAIRYVVESLKAASLTVQNQKFMAAGLMKVMDSLSSAASQTVVTGENVGVELEKQKVDLKQIEEMSRKLDEVSENMNRMLEHFRI